MAASYSLKRFTRIQIIKAITPDVLREFLSPYADYLAGRGFNVGSIDADFDNAQAKDLLSILVHPAADIPQSLVEALYHVDEMATPSGMELLVSEFKQADHTFECQKPTPADIAVRAWIADSSLFQRISAKQHHQMARVFRFYPTSQAEESARILSSSAIEALEEDLNNWSEAQMLGRHCKVFPFISEYEHCYMIRRGQPYARFNAINDGNPSSIVFQPEIFDVIAYNLRSRQLRVASSSTATRDLYRRLGGLHLFGDESYFVERNLLSLLPLATKGPEALVCDDIPGLLDVKLRKVQVIDGSARKRTLTWEEEDVYSNPDFVKRCSGRLKISRVCLGFLTVGASRPRRCELRPPNIISLSRDEDVIPVGEFLQKRGFILGGSTA